MKVHDCKCSSPEFCPDENQWEPGHQCDDCREAEELIHHGLLEPLPDNLVSPEQMTLRDYELTQCDADDGWDAWDDLPF